MIGTRISYPCNLRETYHFWRWTVHKSEQDLDDVMSGAWSGRHFMLRKYLFEVTYFQQFGVDMSVPEIFRLEAALESVWPVRLDLEFTEPCRPTNAEPRRHGARETFLSVGELTLLCLMEPRRVEHFRRSKIAGGTGYGGEKIIVLQCSKLNQELPYY